MTEVELPAGWDQGVLSLRGHVLQSRAWARVQARLGYEVLSMAHRDWCWLGVLRSAGPFRYLYLPFGPTLRNPAALPAAVEGARLRARRRGAAFVRLEPDQVSGHDLIALSGRQVRSRQHQHTLRLRIDVDDATLRGGLNRGHRSRINTVEKRGLSVEQVQDPADIGDFVGMLRQTESRATFYSHDDPYYRAIADELMPTGEAVLYYASAQGRRVAGALLLDYGTTRYYAFAGSDTEGRGVMPAPPLVWRTILDARAKGLQWFDFWGIAPPDEPDHSWAGITEFKRGFGGEVHSRAGTWEIPVRELSSRLFTLAQKLRR